MKLRDLNAWFLRVQRDQVDPTAWIDGCMHTSGIRTLLLRVDLAEAHGIWFDCPCPKCQAPGAHEMHIVIGFAGRGAPDDSLSIGSDGKPSRWNVAAGTGLDDLQLTPSIQLLGGCNWHGFVGSSGVPPGEAQ